jgi:NADPH-dependent 2,4-dienoyl-CoA reductase/sulfur reductase-like enzyme/peroxiredoxin family protein/rhodanese-related sulfurtransferase/TusA-related sulfurtransferase
MKVLIIGGVAGGASTATRLRRNDENIEIIIFEKGKEISYANCGIPYYIGDVIQDRDRLELLTPTDFKEMFNIEIRNYSEVIEINKKSKIIRVKNLLNNTEYEEKYDKLVLSPGGTPIKPPLQGIDNKKIFTVRTLTDMDSIKNFIDQEQPKNIGIIGAGFIGLEIAENMHELGLNVSIIELSNQVMNVVDYEMATIIHEHLYSKKVNLYLKDAVKSFSEDNEALQIKLESGNIVNVDMVILCIGIRPDTTLAKKAELKIGKLGGIETNSKMETSDKDIYALGDAVEIKDCVLEQFNLIPLANSANKQGRIVADNITGKNIEYKYTTGASIVKVFDLAVGTVGVNEKTLLKNNVKYSKVYLQPSSHASYYPNSFIMMIKLLYNTENNKILGSQIVSADGVDKRIDVIASLLYKQGTIYDLANLELSYAPPYNSAKDPANLAGMIAINQVEKRNNVIYWNEVDKYKDKGALFLDVRDPESYNLDHFEGAINIPLEKLRSKIKELPKDKDIILYCNQGKTAYFAYQVLLHNGFTKIKNLSGGIKLYKYATFKHTNIDFNNLSNILTACDKNSNNCEKIIKVNACGLQCPGPILKLSKSMEAINIGETLEVEATDQGFQRDVAIWSEKTNNELISVSSENGKIVAQVKKGKQKDHSHIQRDIPNDKTIIVFSGDLDKALASFIIANGAVSMGRSVTMFFTFWGLNVLRKTEKIKVKKGFMDKMFSMMMPRGSKNLKLSKMNMCGLGTQMIKMVMKNKNVSSLEELITIAIENNIRIVACQMSMDIMGLKQEELLDGVEIGGVASYLGAAENADTNLFI